MISGDNAWIQEGNNRLTMVAKSSLLWDRFWFFPACSLLSLVAVRFAEPIADGDLFWLMAYSKRLLDRQALIPDHTLYSWTKADAGVVYCAWVAEILLYKR